MSDVFLSIAVAVSAVASLVDSFRVLYLAWVSGGLGLFFGVAGFLGPQFPAGMAGAIIGHLARAA